MKRGADRTLTSQNCEQVQEEVDNEGEVFTPDLRANRLWLLLMY
jgi:hypothetical protein